ncbi:Nicotinamide-nucleotide amidohydrolase PncC [Enhygromyxa salina]|uniref:CinA-like protein n=1 Tax=Enhygromyxa salina TaxID=215803 RepID=A0A2S9XUF4_9BACT|nr:CinA family nicotinamide mononucleotide deamidase-related protein [Enhygromyxa salina]PRP96509.1 Nicotinamide-nucleotide amidohydrolase PncC [Enhygromyxa salina]
MPRVRAHLLTIGDELLSGDIVDKNKAWLGRRCRALGLEVVRATTVRDRQQEIVDAIHVAAGDAQVCLVSGGLGPTTDDLTAASAAVAAGVGLVRDQGLADRLTDFFASRGRELVETNLKQADLPAGASVLDNPIGTAAGFALDVRSPDAEGALGAGAGAGPGCWLFSMPGVPRELHLMMREQVEPRLRERFELEPIPRRIYRALGSGESTVQHNVEAVLAAARERSPGLANMFVHFRARYPEVQLILEATPGQAGAGAGAGASAAELATLDEPLAQAIGPALYAIEGDAVDAGEGSGELAGLLVRKLIEEGLTLATAESCTGGGVGQTVTSVSGSSACFVGGVISYSNAVKIAQLGVPERVLEAHGAVSEPVARAMAEGVRARLGADIGVSTTGVAGPGGGTEAKPVGTVDVAVATAEGTTYKRLRLFGRRETVRYATIMWALKLIWDQLPGQSSKQTPAPAGSAPAQTAD